MGQWIVHAMLAGYRVSTIRWKSQSQCGPALWLAKGDTLHLPQRGEPIWTLELKEIHDSEWFRSSHPCYTWWWKKGVGGILNIKTLPSWNLWELRLSKQHAHDAPWRTASQSHRHHCLHHFPMVPMVLPPFQVQDPGTGKRVVKSTACTPFFSKWSELPNIFWQISDEMRKK